MSEEPDAQPVAVVAGQDAMTLWSTPAGSAARLLVSHDTIELWSWTLTPGQRSAPARIGRADQRRHRHHRGRADQRRQRHHRAPCRPLPRRSARWRQRLVRCDAAPQEGARRHFRRGASQRCFALRAGDPFAPGERRGTKSCYGAGRPALARIDVSADENRAVSAQVRAVVLTQSDAALRLGNGGGGIRTLGRPEADNGFRDRPVQPLRHPSGDHDHRGAHGVSTRARPQETRGRGSARASPRTRSARRQRRAGRSGACH